jgi:hypothetical protein
MLSNMPNRETHGIYVRKIVYNLRSEVQIRLKAFSTLSIEFRGYSTLEIKSNLTSTAFRHAGRNHTPPLISLSQRTSFANHQGKNRMPIQKLTVIGLTAFMLAGCAPGDQIGQGATYDNSKEIVTIRLTDGRSLDCLSGPWINAIWYDDGILRGLDGRSEEPGTTLDQVADHACRQYFTARSRGASKEAAAQITRNLYDELTS